jgi:UPF0755 protein
LRILIRVIPVVLVLGVALLLAGRELMNRYLDTPLPVKQSFFYQIESGRGLGSVARDLAGKGVLQRPRWLIFHARLTEQSALLKAGEYRIETGETPRSLLDKFVRGQVFLHSLTVIEGWTFRQLLEEMARTPTLSHDDSVDQTDLVNILGIPAPSTEGWFFPDTYLFAAATSEIDLLARGVEVMKSELSDSWARRADDLKLKTEYEALILASIIEKETALETERPMIAGVFHRRLQKGMRLQTDPTVIYGLGESFDGDLRRADMTSDTPYNTYTRYGLPPTPISLPGKASIDAAVNPAPGDALYFVATGDPDGSHYFSATLEEHNQAVQRYLGKLRSRNRQ